jgi:hypothetical protein
MPMTPPHSSKPAKLRSAQFAAAYFCLVACPIAGILGVLEAGQHLQPPPAAAGLWRVQMRAAPACELARLDGLAMRISQSGEHLTLSFNDAQRTVIPAHFSGGKLWSARGARVNTAATYHREGSVRHFQGSFELASAPGCRAEYRAIRETASPEGAGAR